MTALHRETPKPLANIKNTDNPAYCVQRAILHRILNCQAPTATGPVADFSDEKSMASASPIMDLRLQTDRNTLTVALHKSYSKVGDGTNLALQIIYYRDNVHVFAIEQTGEHLIIIFDALEIPLTALSALQGQQVHKIIAIDDPVMAEMLQPIMNLNIIDALATDDGLEILVDPTA